MPTDRGGGRRPTRPAAPVGSGPAACPVSAPVWQDGNLTRYPPAAGKPRFPAGRSVTARDNRGTTRCAPNTDKHCITCGDARRRRRTTTLAPLARMWTTGTRECAGAPPPQRQRTSEWEGRKPSASCFRALQHCKLLWTLMAALRSCWPDLRLSHCASKFILRWSTACSHLKFTGLWHLSPALRHGRDAARFRMAP
ncbi:MAG: hypothetical protein BJ554DRAFT_4259 [Olpidium bornovanus]|uniref:Uncharacterized protein n=1 Tax=Olpidium bornovanus TaxID=278681 RepID=A0A8H8DF73_9FUNG|nr:MAG: hypothetical protein BJ554DRAFT_4259 [Olpidium bornovanus]